ncbi:MAG TPA: adenylate/guanylate cyclase domain-containing protein [Longimicrobiales bacterium]|nr:adenylate/guanylate cyclase domain-containing protein [Longimicrobiales bacterium]
MAGAAALAAALDAAGELTGLARFEDFTLDLRQQTTPESFQPGRGGRESEIALVLFDAYTVMDPVDGWPWISPFPRAHLAELVDALAAAGARTIGLDVYLDRLYPGLTAIDHGDDLLRAAIERAGNVILVTPVELTDSGPVSRPPHPWFAEVAAGVGSAELPASFDTFRHGTLAVRTGGGLAPSFALALWAHARGLDADSILRAALREGRIDLPGLPEGVGRVPEAWRAGGGHAGDGAAEGAIVPFRIRYVGPPSSVEADAPPGTFQASASGTLPETAALLPDLFRDRIVLIGTGFHEQDRFRTPFYSYLPPVADGADAAAPREPYGWMYGVEVHANALQNMLDGEYVRPTGAAGRLLLLVLAAGAAASVALWRGPAWGAAAALGAALGVVVYAWWAWAGVAYLPWGELFTLGRRFAWVPVGPPVLAALFAYVGSVAYTAVVEGKDKRFIKRAFGKYVSPEIVDEIAENPEALRLGGQKRPLTLLFTDLAGFTTLAENMDPEALLELLNEYLDDMTEAVLAEDGCLDKYIGDAVMAFWNAPKAVDDHADRALRTAVFMQRRMRELNRRWRERDPDHADLTMRIGIHTGEVVVGNVGGEDRFGYSAVGDAVNLAARLEPANKTYGTLTMVSEETLRRARVERYRVRELDLVAVKGKIEPVRVYELLELAGVELAAGKEEALVRYQAGMEAYKARDWMGARACFARALEVCPEDGPSRVYLLRCEQHVADPPPAGWDFVVHRTEK